MTNTQPYADLEIRILKRQDAGYPVEITLNGDQEFPHGFLAADILPWTSTGDPRADGERLFAALFGDAEARKAWERACGQHPQRRVRLRLDKTAPELHALPWELLHDGQIFLAADTDTPFSRYLALDMPPGDLVTEHPIRVLVAIANPDDLQSQYCLTPLNVAEECARLKAAFRGLPVEIVFLDSFVTPEHLETKIREQHPHILHLVAHGTFSSRRDQASLYLQDDEGHVQVITDAAFGEIFRRLGAERPRLVFMAACESASRSAVDAFVGLAPKLVQVGVPAVVAMQDKVAITTTRKLTPVFYKQLFRYGEVDRALNAARSLLLTGQSSDVATPVLLMRLKDGKLFDFERVQRRRKISIIIATLVLLSAIVGVLYGMLRPAPALTGTEFNIAISRFSSGPSRRSASSTGVEMAFYLKDTLRSTMSDLGYSEEQVDIGVYRAIGAEGQPAEVLLDEITRELPDKAVTLLVYGYESEAGSYRVYFRLRNLQEGTEVGDEFLKRDVNQDTERMITAQSEVLAAFTSGLVNLYTGDLTKAKGHFETGIAKAEAAGLEIALDTLYFFQGRTLAALDQSVAAQQAYTTALSYNPQYAMAHIGLGNLIYSDLQKIYYNGKPFTCEDLNAALAEYQLALDGQSTPYTAWVKGKAYVMMGNVYLWCGQVKGDEEQLTQAVAAYDQALAAYERDDARVEYLVMVHYVRGLAYEQLGYRTSLAEESADAVNWYENAITEYTLCANNAGTRISLAQECSQNLVRVQQQLEQQK